MGYTTDFDGVFTLDKPLTPELAAYFTKFSETRRMGRDNAVLETINPSKSDGFNGLFGKDGEYYVGGNGDFGQDRDDSILDYNAPPKSQPGLWCQWIPTDDLSGIEWDGGEKFYYAAEWIEYIIDHFLAPSGYVVNGVVDARGEEMRDIWHIKVTNNVVETHDGFAN